MVKNKKTYLLLAVVFMLAVVVAGCGGGGSSDAGSGGDGGGGGAATTTGGSTASTDTVIRVGISGTPDIDPAVALTASSVIAVVNLYDSLVYPGPDGVEPCLAESWTVSEDGLTYVFKLKEGVKFHNGDELKGNDVAFSMNRMMAIGEGYAYLYEGFVDYAEATGDYEVTMHMLKPFGSFVSSLVRLLVVNEREVMENIVAGGPYGEFGDYGKTFLATNDAGTGAYMFKELVQQDYFEATKFDGWFKGWENRPYAPSGFKQMAIPEPATVRTMMNNKELDMTDQWQSTENLNAMAQMPGVTIGNVSTYLVQNMYMNTQKAPMDDVNFRRAMAYLFDYETICRDIFVNSRIAKGPVSAGVVGHVDTTTFSYNIDKAREYIAASKYANDYQNYTIEMLANSDVANLEKVALMFQAAAKELGITVEISKAPWVSIIDRMGSVETTPQMISINCAPAYDDAGTYLETRYHSKTAGTWTQGEWLMDPAVDQMISDALGTVDEAERLAKYADLQNYIVDDLCPTVFLCDLTEQIAYQSDYITWPLVDNTPPGEIGSTLYGYINVYADFEIHK